MRWTWNISGPRCSSTSFPSLAQCLRTAQAQHKVRELADAKYRSWDWNYGRSPAFNLQRVQRFAIGEVDARLFVEQGVVKEARFYGDFFSSRDIGELERALKGVRYHPEDLLRAMRGAHAGEYLEGVAPEELAKLVY
ncbi:MAG TPA: lipoate protein ligase C-terminal domain-containing protein [Flavobacteriales bacterium]|nr:lipoate protein ligase C-terminal domain-containing protein [Flavobacteriales bacterium]